MLKPAVMTLVGDKGSLPFKKTYDGSFNDMVKIEALSKPLQVHINHSGNRMAVLSRERIYIFDVPSRRHSSISLTSTSLHFLSVDRQQKLIAATQNCIIRYNISGQVELTTHRSDIGTKVQTIVVNYLREAIACLSVHAIELYDFQLKRMKVVAEKNDAFLSCCFASDGQNLVALMKSGVVIIYEMNSYTQANKLNVGMTLHKGQIVCTGEGKIVVAAYGKGLFIFSENLQKMRFFPFPVLKIRTLGNYLLCLSEDHAFHLIDISSKKYKISRLSHPANFLCIQFDVKDNLLAGAGLKTVCIFNISKERIWESLDELQEPEDFLQSLSARRTKPKYRKVVFKQTKKTKLIKSLEEFMAKQGTNKLSPEELILQFFNVYHELPDKQSTHPLFLKTPFDVGAFEALVSSSKLSVVPDLETLKDKKAKYQIINILKAMVSLSENFQSHLSQLIRMVYPLVCIYKSDLTTFEVLLKLLGVYGKGLFGGDQTSTLRTILAECLEIVVPDLYDHFLQKYKARLEEYLYPSMPVFLVDLLGQSQWLQFIDNLVVNAASGNPQFYVIFLCALMQFFEPKLLKINSLEKAHELILSQGEIDMQEILRLATRITNLPPLSNYYPSPPVSLYDLTPPAPLEQPVRTFTPQIAALQQQVDSLSQKFSKSNKQLMNSLHLQIRREQEQRISQLQQQFQRKDRKRMERRRQVEAKEREFEQMLRMKDQAGKQAQVIIGQAMDGMKRIQEIKRMDQEQDQRIKEQQVKAHMKKIQQLREAIKRDVQDRSIAEMRAQQSKMLDKVQLDEFRVATARKIGQLTEKVKNENTDWMNGMATHLITIKQNEQAVANRRAKAQAEFIRNEKITHLKQLEILNQQLQRELVFANSRRITSQDHLSRIMEEENEGTISSKRRIAGHIRKSDPSIDDSQWSSHPGSSRKIGNISNREKQSPQKESPVKRKLREVGKLSRRIVQQEGSDSSSSLSSFDSEGQ